MAKENGLPAGVVINRAGVIGVLKKVPRAVWDHPAWAGRAKVVERSTGTRDRAEGLRQAMRLLVELEDEWARCRAELGRLPPLAVAAMDDDEVADFVEILDTMVAAEHGEHGAEVEGGAPLPTDPAGLVEWAARERGLELDPSLLPRLRAAAAARLADQPPVTDHQRYTANAAKRLAPAAIKTKPAKHRTLDDLIKLFERERLSEVKPSSARNYSTAFEVLRAEVGGTRPLDQIDRDDMRAVRDAIVARPLAPASVRKYVRAVGTVFTFAVDERWMDANPALGLAPKRRPEEDEDDRRPFSAEELGKLFPAGWALISAVDWMLAFGLFQGLRAEEAAQLEVTDIEEIGGSLALHIRPWTPTADGGRSYEAGKSVKNSPSVRTVPVHERIAPALADLVARREATGERMLLEVKRWGDEGYYGSVRKKVHARLREAEVKEARTCYHSLRHNWRDAARAAKLPAGHELALGGWSLGKGAEADYGEGFAVADLAPSLSRVNYPTIGAGPIWECKA